MPSSCSCKSEADGEAQMEARGAQPGCGGGSRGARAEEEPEAAAAGSLRGSPGGPPCRRLDFELLIFGTMREYIFCVCGRPVPVNLLG